MGAHLSWTRVTAIWKRIIFQSCSSNYSMSSCVLCFSLLLRLSFYSRCVFLLIVTSRYIPAASKHSQVSPGGILFNFALRSVCENAAPSDARRIVQGNAAALKVDTVPLPAVPAGPRFRMCCFNSASVWGLKPEPVFGSVVTGLSGVQLLGLLSSYSRGKGTVQCSH